MGPHVMKHPQIWNPHAHLPAWFWTLPTCATNDNTAQAPWTKEKCKLLIFSSDTSSTQNMQNYNPECSKSVSVFSDISAHGCEGQGVSLKLLSWRVFKSRQENQTQGQNAYLINAVLCYCSLWDKPRAEPHTQYLLVSLNTFMRLNQVPQELQLHLCSTTAWGLWFCTTGHLYRT